MTSTQQLAMADRGRPHSRLLRWSALLDAGACCYLRGLPLGHGDGGVGPLLQADVLDLGDALIRPVLTGLGSWGSYNSSYLIKYTVLHYNVACSQVRYVP